MSQDDENYKVTYKKPPKEYQFKKGQSGNPTGRRKGSKSVDTIVKLEANRKVQVTENGKSVQCSKKEAIFKVLTNKCLAGHDKAISTLIPHLQRLDDKEEQKLAAASMKAVLAEDREILKRLGLMEDSGDS